MSPAVFFDRSFFTPLPVLGRWLYEEPTKQQKLGRASRILFVIHKVVLVGYAQKQHFNTNTGVKSFIKPGCSWSTPHWLRETPTPA
jgi:hypothetical protein